MIKTRTLIRDAFYESYIEAKERYKEEADRIYFHDPHIAGFAMGLAEEPERFNLWESVKRIEKQNPHFHFLKK